MPARIRIGPNDLCPCRSGKKYKKCCRGKIDWERIINEPNENPAEYLSLRGKNMFFLERVADALQLDRVQNPNDLAEFKRAFTASAVRKIAEAIITTWPNGSDLNRALREERTSTAAFYSGTYDPEAVKRGVTRHSLYADTILLADPLVDPRHVRPEFNPIENPDQHRSATLRWVTLWFAMSPWIEAGIVKFVRTPGDFDTGLEFQTMKQAEQLREQEPELAALQADFVNTEADHLMKSYKRQMLLGFPDDYLRQRIREWKPSLSNTEVEGILRYMHRLRDADPYFIDTIDKMKEGELLQVTTGTNYYMAKIIAMSTGAHLITDLEIRWKELELDKRSVGFDPSAWNPFAKAFSSLRWQFLDNVPLEAALRLRKENRLENMRSFLRRAWRAAAPEDSYQPSAATELAAELDERIRDAEVEWRAIDSDLLKWFGTELAAGVLGLGPAIAMGAASWAAGGVAVAAATTLAVAQRKRADWETKFPAGFFLGLKKSAPAS
jgi:hypothetical protein